MSNSPLMKYLGQPSAQSTAPSPLALRQSVGGLVARPNTNLPPSAPTAMSASGINSKIAEIEERQLRMREAQEVAEKQRMLDEEIKIILKDLSANCKLRLFAALDFTGSTLGDVGSFKSGTKRLMDEAQQEFALVECIPSIAKGPMPNAQIQVGAVNSFSVFEAENIGYKVVSPPFLAVEQSIDQYPSFLDGSEDCVNAVVVFGDSSPEHPSDIATNYLNANNVYVCTIVGGHVCLPEWKTFMSTFGENGVLIDRRGADMDPIRLVVEALKHRRDGIYRARAEAIAKAKLANVLNTPAFKSIKALPHISLAAKMEQLNAGNPGRILEGGTQKLIEE